MNLKLLREVKKRLIAQSKNPKRCRFDMDAWGDAFLNRHHNDRAEPSPVCNTSACIAGEVVLAARLGKVGEEGGIILNKRGLAMGDDVVPDLSSIGKAARRALGLTMSEAHRLFAPPDNHFQYGRWPNDLAAKYNEARSRTARAKIGAERIARFIRTKGEE